MQCRLSRQNPLELFDLLFQRLDFQVLKELGQDILLGIQLIEQFDLAAIRPFTHLLDCRLNGIVQFCRGMQHNAVMD